jgi:hypothetical protein
MQQTSFNFTESIAARDRGMTIAADNNRDLLTQAREIAVSIARRKGTVTADDVAYEMECRELPPLGNAAGSLFKGKRWTWTGQRIKSARVHAHANELKVWRLNA